MGTPEFAVPSLARLLSDGHEVAAVFTQPDKPAGRGKHLHAPPVKTFAIEHRIAVHQPARIKANEEVRAIFEAIRPDVCVVAAYGKILPEWMQVLSHLSPATYVLDGVREGLIHGTPVTELLHDVWPLIVSGFVLIPFGLWAFGRAERYAKRTGRLKRVG